MADALQPLKLQIPVSKPGGGEALTQISLCQKNDNGELVCDGIARYFGAAYSWLTVAIAFIAVTVVVVGGLQWLVARGDAGSVKKATKTITNAIIGLGLTLGAYIVLYTINPNLVLFKPLQLTYVKKTELPIEAIRPLTADEERTSSSSKNELFLHHSGGTDEAACLKDSKSGKPECQYWVLTTGKVISCADENSVLPCTYGANKTGIGIEMSSVTGKQFTQRQIDATAQLVKEIVARNHINPSNDVSNLNATGESGAGQTGKKGGVFNHSNVCATLSADYGSDVRWDPPENIFKAILDEAGIPYTPNQPRCLDPNIQGVIIP